MSVCCSCYCCVGRVSERTNNESKRVEDNSFFHYNNIVSCETSFSLKGLLNLRRINVLYVLWVSEWVSQSVSIRVVVCIHVYKLPFSPNISQHRDFWLLMSVCVYPFFEPFQQLTVIVWLRKEINCIFPRLDVFFQDFISFNFVVTIN